MHQRQARFSLRSLGSVPGSGVADDQIKLSVAYKFVVPFSVLSIVFGILPAFHSYLGGGGFISDWSLRYFYVNNFDFLFAKRAFIGTFLYPLFSYFGKTEASGKLIVALFELVVLAAMVLMLKWLGTRGLLQNSRLYGLVSAAFILSPAGFMQFSGDLGRYDHLNILIIVGAAFMASHGRYFMAGWLFAMAALVHEAAFFFGFGPVVAALLLNRAAPRDFIICMAPTTIVMAAVLLWGNLSPAELAILASRPGAGTHVWTRGTVELPIHLTKIEIIPLIYYASVPFIVLYSIVRHNGGSVVRIMAPQFMVLLLYPLGSDCFRWAGLGFTSVATTLLMVAERRDWTLPKYSPPMAALLLIYLLPLGPLGVEWPLPLVELVYNHFAGWPRR